MSADHWHDDHHDDHWHGWHDDHGHWWKWWEWGMDNCMWIVWGALSCFFPFMK